ncbi:nuclear transcription factor Y subunit B-1 isoform X1 [Cryptomeria japonica]|uniref:nuclear transcription factor Y subunit B-1 isoform X1 n=2 Tax=Cryptomeria japonica TaxID=3369 RepID=UPI0025ABC77A|nr:nuclear transcription factor Y subunit B-1 isoform X1 [Cryptomeria japonica]
MYSLQILAIMSGSRSFPGQGSKSSEDGNTEDFLTAIMAGSRSFTNQDCRSCLDGDIKENCVVREQDRYMPVANVIRIMRKVLPPHAKIADDAKDTMQECVSEFINFITSEANERCKQEQRKTITADDLLWSMYKLGFEDYVHTLTIYLQKYRELEGDLRGSSRGENMSKKEVNDLPIFAGYQMGHQEIYGSSEMGYYQDIMKGYDINYYPNEDPFAKYK